MTNHIRIPATMAFLLVLALPAGAQIVSQSPLSAGGNVPGNLVLTPSVEWPTLESTANVSASYDPAVAYVGYFDSEKCYNYHFEDIAAGETAEHRHFYPTGSAAAGRVCSAAAQEWSGNFLNWATTQTIDPFRKALTGGFRSTDEVGLTILEKARHDGQGGVGTGSNVTFQDRNITSSATVAANATPANADWGRIRTRAAGFNNRMRFTRNDSADLSQSAATVVAYNPAVHTLTTLNRGVVFEVTVRVKVCDHDTANAGPLEANCVRYSDTNYKPEGLMQRYANRMRFSVFGYLNNAGSGINGAALRGRMKFIGPRKIVPGTGTGSGDQPNTGAMEWDPTTGIMYTNPDASDASATAGIPAITNSGVMNYLNKFGSMTNALHKSNDPVSEMYWAAITYLRAQAPEAHYYTLSTNTALGWRTTGSLTTNASAAYVQADGFPVINWGSEDPVQYPCQNLSILGIGDVYTWNDKRLPGTTNTTNEPGGAWAGETGSGFNAGVWLERISQLEFGNTTSLATPFQGTTGGRANSAYIAAAAYWAHVTDIRPQTSMPGRQTVNTYWVDVRENRRIEARRGNQYFLAAKYGGFEVPQDYNPASTTQWGADKNSWWSNSGETFTSSFQGDQVGEPALGENAIYAQETFRRPDNYYVGDQASQMVEALNRAFAKIASERAGSGSSLAANSTRLDTNTRVYQAQFRNGSWFGQVNAYDIDEATGVIASTPLWRAGEVGVLDTPVNTASRNIWMYNPTLPTGSQYVQFLSTNLSTDQEAGLTFFGMGGLNAGDVVNYLRGSTSREEHMPGGALRTRTPPDPSLSQGLGDVINSTPIFVGVPNPQLYQAGGPTFNGKDDYDDFVTAQSGRTKTLWVGANDGMMHAFNADTGAEIYAFVPNASMINGLGQYANPDYVHKYFVDGDVAVADVYFDGAWRTVLVGTMGRGGPGMFALDITNPAVPEFLWEKGAADIPSLGRNIGRPVIAQVANGDWRVIVGNGPDSSGGVAKLITVELEGGEVTTHSVTSTSTTNGLSAVLARDTNADGFADTAYAGDLDGNLYKFSNLSVTTDGSATTDEGAGVLFYRAIDAFNNPQPITAAPLVGRDPTTGIVWVFFGTGRYLNLNDVTNTSQQTWYGIKDIVRASAPSGRSTLEQRTSSAGPVIGSFQTRVMEEGTASELASADGWYYDLPASRERMVAPNRFQGSALIGTTRIPDNSDQCNPGGSGFIMAINPFTGGRLTQTFFDTNRDGAFNDADKTDTGLVVSGIGLDRLPNAPIFVENTMLISLDRGIDAEDCTASTFACNGTGGIKVQGSSVDTSRMFWREVIRQ